ncbi:hypothetical protein BaRGS_00035876 [Batillaria attramentaria]|uniref:G-protein coupled receptors family 1 profile domain-containing protein n=1 Tax=Batillaria attramentaria TaxID=370345 RepID=A0ABD0JDE8_9CAEN
MRILSDASHLLFSATWVQPASTLIGTNRMDPPNATTVQNNSSDDEDSDCVICDYHLSVGMKTIRVLLGLCIMGSNSVMVVAVLRAHSLQMALRALLVNLALADALMGLAFTYLTLVVDVWTDFSLECGIRYGSLSYLEIVTLYSILIFSVEKVITLARPLTADQLVTKKTLAVALTLLWLLPVAMTAIAYEMRDSQVTECYFSRFTGTGAFLIFASINVIAVAFVIVCQIVIFVIAMIQVNKIAPTMVGQAENTGQVTRSRMSLKVAVTTLTVVAPFLLCSTPLLGGYLYLAVHPEARVSKSYLQVITIKFIFAMLNCAVDPIVFTIRLRSVRFELKRIVHGATKGRLFVSVKDPSLAATSAAGMRT